VKAARLLRLPALLFKAALAYAKAFPDEIAADRAAGRRPLDELKTKGNLAHRWVTLR
jgi:hypothetical protein